MNGHPIHADAAVVLEQPGGGVSNFAARQFMARVASDADLILTITKAHRDAVLESGPRLLHRTFILTEAARLASEAGASNAAGMPTIRPQFAVSEFPDIPDRQGRGVFEVVGQQMAEPAPPILELRRRSSGPVGSAT